MMSNSRKPNPRQYRRRAESAIRHESPAVRDVPCRVIEVAGGTFPGRDVLWR